MKGWMRRMMGLAAAACLAGLPALEAAAATDQTASATASGSVATAFSISVSGNIGLGNVPADGSYSATQTNSVTGTNNENIAWYLKAKVGAVVPGATLEFMGGSIASFSALTAVNQTFKSSPVNPINTPSGTTASLSYRAKSDGSLAGSSALSWTVTYTLTQTL